jgi:hypothetical protein
MTTSIVIPTIVFILIKASMLGETNPVSRSTTANMVVMGNKDQVGIIDEVCNKIHASDKILENISAKMDNFRIAMQNQLSFNKLLETQIQKISAAISSQSNGDSSKTPIQESVRSIFTMFKKKDPKPTEGSLGGVGKDKNPSAVENFSTKFSSRIGNLNL